MGIKIILSWDNWNTALFVSKLMRHKEKREIEFILTTINSDDKNNMINVLIEEVINDETLEELEKTNKNSKFIEDLMKYFKKRVLSRANDGEKLTAPEVFVNDEKIDFMKNMKISYNQKLKDFDVDINKKKKRVKGKSKEDTKKEKGNDDKSDGDNKVEDGNNKVEEKPVDDLRID